MIFAVDVSYQDNSAFVAGILFRTWESSSIDVVHAQKIDFVAEYEPGSFYKRELPCILAILNVIDGEIDTIVIDGYVTLGAEKEYGLGMHLWDALGHRIPIIGVAKNYFKGTPHSCEILRGESSKPLFITSVGIDLEEAKMNILNMHGKHRIPDLLKIVDQKSKEI